MDKDEHYWEDIFPHAAYFHVYNSVLGNVFAMVYNDSLHDSKLNTLSTFIIAKHGCSIHPSIDISSNSIYYPAVANLSPGVANSKVRKALAISLLKTFATLDQNTTNLLYNQANLLNETFDWDETQAGLLASQMQLIDSRTPQQIGNYIYQLGYLNQINNSSNIVDIVYNEKDDLLSDQNNALAYLIGTQLDQLFDPLTEYSPEPTEKVYKPPIDKSTVLNDSDLVTLISSELITVQTNYTVSLVQFLQNFIVPLRIKVLENKIPNLSINQLNQIFPPTIDEVTRINCIFLDMLKLAQPFGSYEILKACGETIPYFYKAQMRHEAAIKNFHSNYLTFKHLINKDDIFDQRTIETCIYSSLNLVKLQLIIQRLVKNGKWPENLLKKVELYSKSCNETISSFATDKLLPYNGRIFTPTGKILTEIANGLPPELQFGWLTRRVVAVFDATDVLSNSIENRSVIIVFSDHVLFLEIKDVQYYLDYWNESNKIHKPSISDILIHSLTNETPLNNLPQMTVKSWSDINNLNAIYYSFESTNYIRFFNESDPNFVGIYKIDKVLSKYVTEVLARSKILNKSQSFHLFSNNNDENKIYYTAHELSSYVKEDSKSPFIIFFNENYDAELLNSYNIFAFITLNFVDENTIKLESISKSSDKISYNIQINSLANAISDILMLYFKKYLSLENSKLSEYLLSNNENVNSQANKVLNTTFEKLQLDKEKLCSFIKKDEKERKIVNAVANTKTMDRRKSLELLNEKVTIPKKTNKVNTNTVNSNRSVNKPINRTSDKSAINSFHAKDKKSSRLFNFFKSKQNKQQSKLPIASQTTRTASKPTKPKVIKLNENPERKSSVIIKRVSLKGKNREINYNSLKPAKPKSNKLNKVTQSLGVFSKEPSSADMIIDRKSISKTQDADIPADIDYTNQNNQPNKINSNNTNTGNYNNNNNNNNNDDDNTTVSTSIYVNSHFEFPMAPSKSTGPMTTSPKYGFLKSEPGHKKGYKDSADLMNNFVSKPNNVTGITDSIDLVSKPNSNKSMAFMDKLDIKIPEDNHIYDDDLFEFTTTPKTATFSINENSSTPVIMDKYIDKINRDNPNDGFEKHTDLTLPDTKSPPLERETPSNSPTTVDIQNPWRLMALPKKSPVIESSSNPPCKIDKKNTFISKIKRSQSFYDRFKQLRDDQEKILKSGGISYIKDINKLPKRDQEILSHGLLFTSIKSGLNKKITIDENAKEVDNESNWIIQEDDAVSLHDLDAEDVNQVEEFNIPNIPDNKFEEIKIEPTKIIVKPISHRVLPSLTNHSVGSSVYLSDIELERLGSIKPLENVYNPYYLIPEEQEVSSGKENKDQSKDESLFISDENLFISDENSFIPNQDLTIPHDVYLGEEIPMYHDDVDLLGDLAIDKINLDMSMFDSIDYDNLSDTSSGSVKNDHEEEENFNLTLGNLTITDLTNSYFDTTTSSLKLGIKSSDTRHALNSLLKDKSYAYLNDILEGVYEDDNGNIVGNIHSKPLKGNVTFKDLKDIKSRSKRNISIKRDPTDYDLAYCNKLMNSSITYLSDYMSNYDSVF